MRSLFWPAGGMLALLTACGVAEVPPPPPVPVTVAAAIGSADREGVRYSGAIKADESVDLAFRVSGIVDAITQVRGADGRSRAIQDGDPVHRGMVLARLRQDEFRDQLADTDATLRQATADHDRASRLFESGAISRAEYDAVLARFSASQARRSQVNLALEDATLRAPIDGVILRRAIDVGSLAGPTSAAFTIASTTVVKVAFGVPDVVVVHLKLGEILDIQAEALPGETLKGRITRIAPSADPNSRIFEVEAALPNPDGRLKVGMLATLTIADGPTEPGVLVPLAAIVQPPADTDGYAVYVVKDSVESTARMRRVQLGPISRNLIAVRAGLGIGERVVVRGATLVSDGQTVQVTH